MKLNSVFHFSLKNLFNGGTSSLASSNTGSGLRDFLLMCLLLRNCKGTKTVSIQRLTCTVLYNNQNSEPDLPYLSFPSKFCMILNGISRIGALWWGRWTTDSLSLSRYLLRDIRDFSGCTTWMRPLSPLATPCWAPGLFYLPPHYPEPLISLSLSFGSLES